MTEEEIVKICQEYNIENYKINPDMSIDVDDNVNLSFKNLTHLPIKFGKVSGDFNCSSNQLSTLNNCPLYVGGHFDCYSNQLTTLQHLPINFYVGGEFQCRYNYLTIASEYSKLFFGYIGGNITTNYVIIDKFLNDNKNPPKKDLPRLLSELRKITL